MALRCLEECRLKLVSAIWGAELGLGGPGKKVYLCRRKRRMNVEIFCFDAVSFRGLRGGQKWPRALENDFRGLFFDKLFLFD